jgi:hypothetical protein
MMRTERDVPTIHVRPKLDVIVRIEDVNPSGISEISNSVSVAKIEWSVELGKPFAPDILK